MSIRHAALLLGLVAAACQANASETASDSAPAAAPEREIDPRDQYALLADIEAVIGDSLARDPIEMGRVRGAWQDSRVRWDVAFVPVLCRRADACHVAPFDHARRPERGIQQGWMPKLGLDESGHTALLERCAGKRVCVIQVEGTISDFVFDPELPTSLALADVRVLEAREAAASEAWFRSASPRKRA